MTVTTTSVSDHCGYAVPGRFALVANRDIVDGSDKPGDHLSHGNEKTSYRRKLSSDDESTPPGRSGRVIDSTIGLGHSGHVGFSLSMGV